MDFKGQKIKGEGIATKQSDFAIYKLGDYLPWLLGRIQMHDSPALGLVSIFAARHCTYLCLVSFTVKKKKKEGQWIGYFLMALPALTVCDFLSSVHLTFTGSFISLLCKH